MSAATADKSHDPRDRPRVSALPLGERVDGRSRRCRCVFPIVD